MTPRSGYANVEHDINERKRMDLKKLVEFMTTDPYSLETGEDLRDHINLVAPPGYGVDLESSGGVYRIKSQLQPDLVIETDEEDASMYTMSLFLAGITAGFKIVNDWNEE